MPAHCLLALKKWRCLFVNTGKQDHSLSSSTRAGSLRSFLLLCCYFVAGVLSVWSQASISSSPRNLLESQLPSPPSTGSETQEWALQSAFWWVLQGSSPHSGLSNLFWCLAELQARYENLTQVTSCSQDKNTSPQFRGRVGVRVGGWGEGCYWRKALHLTSGTLTEKACSDYRLVQP